MTRQFRSCGFLARIILASCCIYFIQPIRSESDGINQVTPIECLSKIMPSEIEELDCLLHLKNFFLETGDEIDQPKQLKIIKNEYEFLMILEFYGLKCTPINKKFMESCLARSNENTEQLFAYLSNCFNSIQSIYKEFIIYGKIVCPLSCDEDSNRDKCFICLKKLQRVNQYFSQLAVCKTKSKIDLSHSLQGTQIFEFISNMVPSLN